MRNIVIFLILILLNTLLALSQPLSLFVDEGQYLLTSKKMLEGWVPYRDIAESKPLGMHLSLIPAVLLCGTDFVKLRLYAAFIVSLTAFFIFLIGERIKNVRVGLLGAVIFACIEAFPNFYGYNLLTEPIANLVIAALFYLLVKGELDSKRALLIGILTAAACSVKQTSVFVFIPLAFVFLYCNGNRKRILLSFLVGGCIVAIPILLYLALNSALGDAAYWTCLYLIKLGGSTVEYKIETFGVLLFLFSPFAFPALLSSINPKKDTKIIWLWLVGSLVLIQVGYAWLHNYLFAAPPLSILAALGIDRLFEMMRTRNALGYAARGALIILYIIISLMIFLEMSWISNIRASGSTSSFYPSWEDQRRISEFISSNTNSGDGIFVFRSNPEIYYLSDRKPVTRMTFFFGGHMPAMSEREMDEFVFQPLEKHKPEYFVFNAADFEFYREEKNALAVKRYLDEKYEYVMGSGPLQVYRIKS